MRTSATQQNALGGTIWKSTTGSVRPVWDHKEEMDYACYARMRLHSDCPIVRVLSMQICSIN